MTSSNICRRRGYCCRHVSLHSLAWSSDSEFFDKGHIGSIKHKQISGVYCIDLVANIAICDRISFCIR